jgi:glutamate carboxypeptidase
MQTVDFFSERLSNFLDEVRTLVEIDTPTGDVAGAERAAEFIVERFAETATVETEFLRGYGPLLRIRRPSTGPRVLLLAHFDTVWPTGSWDDRWQERDGRIYGPGVYDMKAGLLFLPWILHWLEATGREHPDLEIVLNPDEEVGSLGSRDRIGAAASAADYALVLEPANPAGNLKLARKGSGEYQVSIEGRPAHQGVEPEDGVNAVVEAAHQIIAMLELENFEAGSTVGPNIISGGTASNTVAANAEIVVDVRAWSVAEQERLTEGLLGLKPVLDGAKVSLHGQWNRPPMESTPASLALFHRAKDIGAGLGLELDWVAWGGSSDANLAAITGTPTMDGLGPVGDDAHQFTENILVDQLPVRMALLAELVASLTKPPSQ